jgi:hypothetical protein
MRIDAVEGELLTPEIALLVKTLPDPAARERYTALLGAVQEGEVGDDLVGHLGTLLEISLESGRVRHFYGADGETALVKLFRRTPAGKALSDATSEVTDALRGLQGQTVETIDVAPLGPGAYSLTIDTDRCQITLQFDRRGVRVGSVAVGI